MNFKWIHEGHTWPRSRSNACVLRSRSERERNRRDFEMNANAWIPWTHAFICVQFSRHFLLTRLFCWWDFYKIFKNNYVQKFFKKKFTRDKIWTRTWTRMQGLQHNQMNANATFCERVQVCICENIIIIPSPTAYTR